jgi:hypothetical protein
MTSTWLMRFGLIGVLLVCLVPSHAARGSAVPADDSDRRILSVLDAPQRANVIIADRDGSPRVVDATIEAPASSAPSFEPSVTPTEPPLDVVTVNASKTTSKLALTQAPTAAVPAQTLRPSIGAIAVRTPQAVPSHRARAPQTIADLLQLDAASSYVPTSDSEKPSDRPTPTVVNKHDAAWLYEHRFDTPSPSGDEDLRIPGIPVRSQVASPFDIRSGAFHGVRAVNGYSALRAEVTIPCGVRHFMTGPGFNEVTRKPGIVDLETGYIYIGGWGAGNRGVAVDAGLQKSSAQALSDDYAFYFKYASNKPITSVRFPCGGPDVFLELYPVTNDLLVFSATGTLANGHRTTVTIVQKTKPEDGWMPDGGSRSDGIILKRIVAIAQPPSWRDASNSLAATRFISGTYFGVDNPQHPVPRIVWKRCEIGRVIPPRLHPNYQPWTNAATWYSSQPGMYLDWPPLGVFRSNASSANACDAAGILLHA